VVGDAALEEAALAGSLLRFLSCATTRAFREPTGPHSSPNLYESCKTVPGCRSIRSPGKEAVLTKETGKIERKGGRENPRPRVTPPTPKPPPPKTATPPPPPKKT
jgi:hypothetical protein